MLVSYIIGAGASGVERFSDSIPTIFQIQGLIEAAWDQGINAQGRIETGGIRGTRKYIGTPEVQALTGIRRTRSGTDAEGTARPKQFSGALVLSQSPLTPPKSKLFPS